MSLESFGSNAEGCTFADLLYPHLAQVYSLSGTFLQILTVLEMH